MKEKALFIVLIVLFANCETGENGSVPDAPWDIYARAASSSSITVTWSSVSGAEGYRIYRAASSYGVYSFCKATASTSYTDTNLLSNTTYYYKVTACNKYGESALSNYDYATTSGSSGSAPSAPTGVTATATSSSSITVTWSSVSSATSYDVYRATSSTGTYSYRGYSYSTSYIDTGLSAGTLYYYKVSASNSYGESALSSYGYAWTTSSGSVPSAPTGVTATAMSSSSITVSWYSVSGATEYWVYRATSSSGTYSYRGYSSSTSYIDTGLSASTLYYYKVTASNSYGESALSSYDYAMTTSISSPSIGSPLTQNTWTNGTISSGARYYYFYATSGTLYKVSWNDSYQGDGTKTLDVVVSAYWYSDNTSIFSATDSGYTYGKTFTASQTGYVMLKVEPYSSGTGTYAIAYQ